MGSNLPLAPGPLCCEGIQVRLSPTLATVAPRLLILAGFPLSLPLSSFMQKLLLVLVTIHDARKGGLQLPCPSSSLAIACRLRG